MRYWRCLIVAITGHRHQISQEKERRAIKRRGLARRERRINQLSSRLLLFCERAALHQIASHLVGGAIRHEPGRSHRRIGVESKHHCHCDVDCEPAITIALRVRSRSPRSTLQARSLSLNRQSGPRKRAAHFQPSPISRMIYMASDTSGPIIEVGFTSIRELKRAIGDGDALET